MQRTTLLLLIAASISLVLANNCASNPLPDATYESGYCGFYHFVNFGKQAGGLIRPRGIDTAPNGDLLTVDSANGNIWAVFEDSNGNPQGVIIGNQPGLNHACRFNNGYVYASSDIIVYRWQYNGRSALTSQQQVVVNMPPGGAHNTRTIEFQGTTIYVNIGSGLNIDPDDSRSKIISTSLTSSLPVDYNACQIVAIGVRNSCGLRFDTQGVLWSAENSLEIAAGPNYANNPADVLRRFTSDVIGKFFGYPYCYTEGWVPGQTSPARTPGLGPGTQWAVDPTTQYTDAWCQNTANVVPPAFPLRAHEAPLDIYFYTGTAFNGITGVPMTVNHGANNRSISVYALNSDGSANKNVNTLRRLVYGPYAWQISPVAMTIAPCKAYGQCIFFTDDGNGGSNAGIHALAYVGSSSSCSKNCGSTPCCKDGNSGDTCYVSGLYNCATDQSNGKSYVCAAGQAACNGVCYDPSAGTCSNGQVITGAQVQANCQSMFASLSCQTASEDPTQIDATAVLNARNWLCSTYPQYCTAIQAGGQYSGCNSAEQMSYAMSLYYNDRKATEGAGACSFGGVGHLVAGNSATPSTQNTGTPATSANSGTPTTTTSGSGSSTTSCTTMFSQQQCRTASEDPTQVDATAVTNARNWLCGTYPQYCTAIVAGGQYASCNSVEQLSYAMTQYYNVRGSIEGANACNFGNVAKLYAVSGSGSGASTTTTSGTPATSNSGTPATSSSGNNCQNMFAGLQCRTSSESPAQVDAQAVTNARNWLCGNYPQYCTDIVSGGQYSTCNSVEQLSNAMNKYYTAVGPSEGASACNFGGVAQVYSAGTPSTQNTGTPATSANSGTPTTTTSGSGSSTTSCTTMFSQQKCRTSSENPAQVDSQSVINARNWLCNTYPQFCVNVNTGGIYASCNSVEQLSYAMSQYYAQFGPQQGTNACNFGGVGQLYN